MKKIIFVMFLFLFLAGCSPEPPNVTIRIVNQTGCDINVYKNTNYIGSLVVDTPPDSMASSINNGDCFTAEGTGGCAAMTWAAQCPPPGTPEINFY